MLCHTPALCRQVLPLKQGEKAGEVLLIGRPANAMVRQGSTKVCMSIKNVCPFSLAEGKSFSTSSVQRCLDLVQLSISVMHKTEELISWPFMGQI